MLQRTSVTVTCQHLKMFSSRQAVDSVWMGGDETDRSAAIISLGFDLFIYLFLIMLHPLDHVMIKELRGSLAHMCDV